MGEKKVELKIEELEERIAPVLVPCGAGFFCEKIDDANFANGKGAAQVDEVFDAGGVSKGGRLTTPGEREVFVPLKAIERFL